VRRHARSMRVGVARRGTDGTCWLSHSHHSCCDLCSASTQSPLLSSPAMSADVECNHSFDSHGDRLVTDETYEPVGVGQEARADPDAVKFQKVRWRQAEGDARIAWSFADMLRSAILPCARQIVFLGTGSAIPSPGRRNTSAIAVILNNASTILLDCGQS
jgi:hypothetical protein